MCARDLVVPGKPATQIDEATTFRTERKLSLRYRHRLPTRWAAYALHHRASSFNRRRETTRQRRYPAFLSASDFFDVLSLPLPESVELFLLSPELSDFDEESDFEEDAASLSAFACAL